MRLANKFVQLFTRRDNFHFYILLAIILLAAFLRFYNFPYRYGLGEETIRDAVMGIEGARELQFPLTGAFSSLGPFTFGPLYTYQLIVFTLLFPFVFSPWIYLGLLSVLYVVIIYKIGEILKGKNFGLLLALIVTLSPAQIISGTHLTSHNMTNIFAALGIWIFLKIIQKNISYWWGFALGIALGFGISSHYQMGGLFILPIILFFYKRKQYLYFITSILGVFATFIPLLFFELNNHWFNVRNMIYYFLYGKNAMYVPNRWLFYLRDFWPDFWSDALGVPRFMGLAIIALFLFIILWSILKKRLPFLIFLLLIAFLLNFVLLRYYWGPRFFGYLNFLRPFVFIFTGFALINLVKFPLGKYIASVFFAAIIITAYPKITDQLNRDPFSLKMYDQVSSLENKYPNKKFTFYGCSIYRSGYNPTAFSTVFVLDMKRKLSDSGIKIGLRSNDCPYPKNSGFAIGEATPSAKIIEKIYPTINEIGLIDLTNATSTTLLEAGWKQVNFKSIYELNARWWFKEQP